MRAPGRILSPWDLKALFSQSYFIPTPQYSEGSIPDLEGKVIIVTGANTGIGFQTARVLLKKNATVYIAARSPEKAQAAIKELEGEIPKTKDEGRIKFLHLDLADLKKTRAAAREFMSREKRLDVLFNSGGVMYPPTSMKTADGYDLQWGTNVLGHFSFTIALLPVLIRTAKGNGGFVRVINTSSMGHILAPGGGVDFENMGMNGLLTQDRYHLSKLGNVLFSNELARRYSDQGILSVSLNPGNIRTELTRHLFGIVTWTVQKVMLYPVELGAITQLYAGTSSDLKIEDSGAYFVPWARRAATNHPKAQDAEMARRMWEWCEGEVEKVTGEKALPAA